MELELRNGSHPPLEMEIDIFRPLNQLSKEGVCLFLVVGEWLSALKGIHSPGYRMSSAFKGVPRLRDREYLRWNINAHTCDIRVSIPRSECEALAAYSYEVAAEMEAADEPAPGDPTLDPVF